MSRLIWKELREKWIWLLPLVASTSGLILFHDAYMFLGGGNPSAWLILSLLVALGLGASTYSSELAGGTADFLRSRPVSWKEALIAKLIVGLSFLLVTCALAALTFRLTCPGQYLRFAGLSDLARGFGLSMLILGIAYAAGFISSAVLPGAFGSMLVAGAAVTVYMLIQYSLDQTNSSGISYWSAYSGIVGAAVAMVLISRFGLTLPPRERLARFFVIVAAFAFVAAPFDYYVKYDPLNPVRIAEGWALSPDASYGILYRWSTKPAVLKYERSFVVRTRDGRRAALNTPGSASSWISDHALWHRSSFAARGDDGSVWISAMDHSGKLHSSIVSRPRPEQSSAPLVPSPGGVRIMIATDNSERQNSNVKFADMATMRPIPGSVNASDYWWISDTEIGYTDKSGTHRKRLVE